MVRKLPLLALLAWAVPAAGAEPKKAADNSPEAVAGRAVAALKEDRLDDFARAMHPDALKQLKGYLVAVVEAADRADKADEVLRLFAGVKTVDELKKLEEGPLFVAFYRGVTRVQPALGKALAGAEVQVLGHVPEGKDLAHVVVRMTIPVEDLKVTKTDVISLRKTEAGWAMLLNTDLENMVTALKRRYAGDKK